jgi:hypothetical protein
MIKQITQCFTSVLVIRESFIKEQVSLFTSVYNKNCIWKKNTVVLYQNYYWIFASLIMSGEEIDRNERLINSHFLNTYVNNTINRKM